MFNFNDRSHRLIYLDCDGLKTIDKYVLDLKSILSENIEENDKSTTIKKVLETIFSAAVWGTARRDTKSPERIHRN